MLKIEDEKQFVKLVRACINAIGTPKPEPIGEPLVAWSSYGISATVLGRKGVDAFEKLVQHLGNSYVEGKPAKQIYALKTLRAKAQELISDVVNHYNRYATKEQVRVAIGEWALNFHPDLPSAFYYAPIINLKLTEPLAIGKVILYPASTALVDEIVHNTPDILKKRVTELFSPKNCDTIAKVPLCVDETLGHELCVSYTEQALNVLRYYGYFLYSRPEQAYIGIQGHLSKVNFSILHHIPGKKAGLSYRRTGPLAPYDLSGENLEQIRKGGLDFLSTLLANDEPNEVEAALLGAIEWAGRASQSLKPEARYLNFWVAIELLLTCDADKRRQDATLGSLIAARASRILPFVNEEERDKARNYWNNKLYKVRCDLVHRGRSEDLADHLPKLESYGPIVIMSYIKKLMSGSAPSSKDVFLSQLDADTL